MPPQPNKGYPSTQEHIIVRDVRDNVAILRTGDMAALVEVEGVDLTRLSDESQRGLIVQFENFLLSLRFPYQMVVARKRQRLEEYLAYVQDQAKQRRHDGNEHFAKALYGFVGFMQEVAQQVNAQAPLYLIVVPYDPVPIEERTRGKMLVTQERFTRGIDELAHRTDAVVRGLTRLGLGSRRLNDQEIISVLYRVYHPSVPDFRVPPSIRMRSVIAQLQADQSETDGRPKIQVPKEFTGLQ